MGMVSFNWRLAFAGNWQLLYDFYCRMDWRLALCKPMRLENTKGRCHVVYERPRNLSHEQEGERLSVATLRLLSGAT
jgi:hypothetical protein